MLVVVFLIYCGLRLQEQVLWWPTVSKRLDSTDVEYELHLANLL